jgi:hypothetical protein
MLPKRPFVHKWIYNNLINLNDDKIYYSTINIDVIKG